MLITFLSTSSPSASQSGQYRLLLLYLLFLLLLIVIIIVKMAPLPTAHYRLPPGGNPEWRGTPLRLPVGTPPLPPSPTPNAPPPAPLPPCLPHCLPASIIQCCLCPPTPRHLRRRPTSIPPALRPSTPFCLRVRVPFRVVLRDCPRARPFAVARGGGASRLAQRPGRGGE